jgi:hypothetical protein
MSGARSGAWSPCRWTRGRRASSSHIPRRIRAPRSCSCPLKSLPSRRANPQIEPAAPAARFGATFGPPAPPIELRAGAAPICRREGLDTDAERGSGELKGAVFNGRAGSKKPRSTVLIQPHHTTPRDQIQTNPTREQYGRTGPASLPARANPPASEGSGIREICWRRRERGRRRKDMSRERSKRGGGAGFGMEFFGNPKPLQTDGTGPAGRQPTNNAFVQLPCRCVQCDPPSFVLLCFLVTKEGKESGRSFLRLSSRLVSSRLVQGGGERERTEKDGTAGGTNENDGNYTHTAN